MANFIELITAKEYGKFQDAVTESLDNNAVEVFNEFREIVGERIREGHSNDQSRTDLINQATDPEKMKVFNADGTEEVDSPIPDALNAQLNTEELEAVIGVLLDEGVLTEEDLDTVTEEELLELSKSTLGSYINKARVSYGKAALDVGKGKGAGMNPEITSGQRKTLAKRGSGITKAVKRLTKEDVEQPKPGTTLPDFIAKSNGLRNSAVNGPVTFTKGKSIYPASKEDSERSYSETKATKVKEAIVQDYNKSAPLDSTSNAVWNGVTHIPLGPDENDVFMNMLGKPEPGKTDKELGLRGRAVTDIVARYRNKIAGTKDVE